MRLSIICPALICRGESAILGNLQRQAEGRPVEVLALADAGTMTVGEKMNRLYGMASGEYVCGVGDDDQVATHYVDDLLGAIGETEVVTFDVDWGGLRLPKSCDLRPMAAVRTELARKFTFPHWWQSEDRAFKLWLRDYGPTEKHIDDVLYFYSYRPHKPEFGGKMYSPQGRCASDDEVQRVIASQRMRHA